MTIFTHLAPPLFAFIVTFLGVAAALRIFPRLKIMDRPGEYGLSRKPIPYSGGVVMFLVFVAATLIFVEITQPVAGLLIAATLIVIVSFIDDRIRLSPWLRLCVQIFAAIILIFSGVQIQQISNPLGAPFLLDGVSFEIFGKTIWLLSALLIIGWIVVMMNVMNWLDGIPGLASGISVIAQTALFFLSLKQFHVVDQSAVIMISGIIAACAFAFLLFDFPPAKILMGDTGSMFLGFMLGSLSILAGGKMATALLIMGFPVLDAVWVVLRRVLRGKSPLRGDYSHLHHQLLRAGFSERTALLFNYLFCGLFALIALALSSTYYKFIAFAGVLGALGLVGVWMLYKSRR